jgi:hypothetical protein
LNFSKIELEFISFVIRLLNDLLPCGLYDRVIELILRRPIENEGLWASYVMARQNVVADFLLCSHYRRRTEITWNTSV